MIGILSPNLMLAFSGYVVATASPRPSNLAIMAVAMKSGRRVRSRTRSLCRANLLNQVC